MERTLVSENGVPGDLGTQTRVVCDATDTIVEAFAPYEPTVQWHAAQEPTAAWALNDPRPAPNPWWVGVGSAGLALTLVAGFILGRTVSVSAADRTGTARPVVSTGPVPFVPEVLPQAPDLSRSYPVPIAPQVIRPAASIPVVRPQWATAPAPVPQVAIRPVSRPNVNPEYTHAANLTSATVPAPPPVQLYGNQRRVSAPVVVTWRLPQVSGNNDG